MNIAFYAPMKPPDAAIPSGERLIARLFLQALAEAGHQVELASRLRSFDKHGSARRQQRLAGLGQKLAGRLLRRWLGQPPASRPRLWFTYHLYHKAPDWIGPIVADALGIPYVVAEASFAPKQQGGKWAAGHDAVAAALARADLVLSLNDDDRACLLPCVQSPERVQSFPPFLDAASYQAARQERESLRARLAARHGLNQSAPWMLAAAMMREGDKLASYLLLAASLSRLQSRDWQLLIAGDGPAAPEIRRAFAPLGRRVIWLGQCDADEMAGLYAAADLLVWPAIREAIGMSLLEAQSAGLPVVAGRSGAVPQIIADGETGLVAAYGDEADFARRTEALLTDPERRIRMGQAAMGRVQQHHDLPAAARRLGAALERLNP